MSESLPGRRRPELLEQHLGRRGFLTATLAAGLVLTAPRSPVTAHAAVGDLTLQADGLKVVASTGGRISVYDGSDTLLWYGSKFQTKDTAAGTQLTVSGTPTLVQADGEPAIRMDYTMPAAAAGQSVYALIVVGTRRAHVEWHVTGPSTLIPDGFMFSRAPQGATSASTFVPLTRWVRDSGGGVPYEEAVGVAYATSWGEQHGLFVLDRSRSREDWTTATWVHAPATPGPGGDLVTAVDFYLSDLRPNATACVGTGTDIGVELRTGRPYNLFEPGQQVQVTYQVANGAPAPRTVDLQWWVRDYNGRELLRSSTRVDVPASGVTQRTFAFDAPAYGLAVVEVAAGGDGQEALARTNVSVLPAVGSTSGPASMFGIANYAWLVKPTENDLLDLWQRAGISRVRIAYAGGPGLPPASYDARGIAHNVELQPSLTADDATAVAWAATSLSTAVSAGAEYFEVGNELNRPFNSGNGADTYIAKALRPVHERRTATGADVKIMTQGLAGPDLPWIRNFHAAGGWDLIDAISFHPGRGNFTPDYIPPGDPSTWDTGTNGYYWNFLGGLRAVRALVDQYGGGKELWLTEAYAATRPNYWWSDTYRHGGENVFLTLALAMAHGVRGVLWYTFFDSVLGRSQVADPGNVEYHFGLINRDLSLKPSLFAYATAVRLLDGATFVRELSFDDTTSKGLLFDTADGPLAVLWNRTDGYLLNADHPHDSPRFPGPEVWQDPWPSKLRLRLAAAGDTVTEYDSIGQSRRLSANGGLVDVVLDGAPRAYLGLDLGSGGREPRWSRGPLTVTIDRRGESVRLLAQVENTGSVPADVELVTPLGRRSFEDVPPGGSARAQFPVSDGQIAGGQVRATLRTRDDRAGTTVRVAYSPYPLAATPVTGG